MPKNPIFELFEKICVELSARPRLIISEDDVDGDLLEDLAELHDETDQAKAFDRSIEALDNHFRDKGVRLPFSFIKTKRRFQVSDKPYVDFIAGAAGRRGVGRTSREFEVDVVDRLSKRLTGAIHRVGVPRTRCRKKREYERYLRALGFDENVLGAHDQDGGFDILWLPPLGAIPLRPLISIQCKNSSFDEEDANSSVGRATRTLNRHSYVRGQCMHFVVFNDYIDETFLGRARAMVFVPLGLSDLGAAQVRFERHVL